MKTKEEVIKEAYGDFYEPNKDFICLKNGCVTKYIARRMREKGFSMSECPTKHDSFLPSSIKHLHTNNGWIKIEREYDYPSPGQYWVIDNNEDMFMTDAELFGDIFDWSSIRYYQPIVKPKLPLY